MFTIQNPTGPNIRCLIDSINTPGCSIPLVTDADGVAQVSDLPTAQALVDRCGYAWVPSAPLPDGYAWLDGQPVPDTSDGAQDAPTVAVPAADAVPVDAVPPADEVVIEADLPDEAGAAVAASATVVPPARSRGKRAK